MTSRTELITLTSAPQDRLFAGMLIVWAIVGDLTTNADLTALIIVSWIVTLMTVRYLVGQFRLHNFILGIALLVLISFSLFAVIVLNDFNDVVPERQFDFSVFSFATVRTAFVANTACLAAFVLGSSLISDVYRPSAMFSMTTDAKSRASNNWPTIGDTIFLMGNWALIASVLFLVPNVYEFPYPENTGKPGDINFNVRVFLALIPFCAFILRLSREGFVTTAASFTLRLTFYTAAYCIAMVHGSRGPVTGLLLVVLVVDAVINRDKIWVRGSWILLDCFYLLFAVLHWPAMRSRIAVIGWWPAFTASFDQYRTLFPSLRSDGLLLSSVPTLGQALFHFLYVIALVDSNDGCGLRTFINLLPQQLPDVLDGVLWERPINDNWLLSYQYHHGGGFYVPANAYWNSGLVTAIAFMAALGACLAVIERAFKDRSGEFLFAYFAFLYLIPVDLYYGIQGLVRCLEYGIIALIAVKYFVSRDRI